MEKITINDGKKESSDHHLISPTAKLVAYMREKSDIPFSKEISRLTDSATVVEDFTDESINPEDLRWWMSPMVEMRYKSLSGLVQKEALGQGVKNVFEFASGMLPRGIVMSENQEINYVETDLPDILEEKKILLRDGLKIDMTKRNLSLYPLDVLDTDEMKRLAETMPEGPICFICEGLMPYLSVPKKETMAKGVLEILKKHGGVWITPELSSMKGIREIMMKYPETMVLLNKINETTNQDLRANSIGEPEDAIRFFENLGFDIKMYKQKDFVEHFSTLEQHLSQLDDDRKQLLEAFVNDAIIWVLRAK